MEGPVNTQFPGGYAGRDRMGEQSTLGQEKLDELGKGVGQEHRRKLGSEHSQLPSGPCNPAEPHSAAAFVQSRGDIS